MAGARTFAPAESAIAFGPFVLDRAGCQLRRGARTIELRRKAWSVLGYLVERSGVMVTADELLDAVWPGVAVTPQTLTNVIGELRAALDDHARQPRWIETVHGRGYRFLAPMSAKSSQRPAVPELRDFFVGRTRERAELRRAWERAMDGERQVVFVSGEPGCGKTALVDAVVAEDLCAGPRVARGQCIEQSGAAEPYLPLLDALATLGRATGAREVRATLRRFAPTWLVQLPWLTSPTERRRLESRLGGTTAVRMLREGAIALEEIASAAGLVLVLEDLHWSDSATLDFLSAIARRRRPARLLVIATYRQADAVARSHAIAPLSRELRASSLASELSLSAFDASEVRAFLEAYLGDAAPAMRLAERARELTAGNPLFLRALAEPLAGRLDVDGAEDLRLPASLRDFVQGDIESASPSAREALEAASVAGLAFTAGEVAAALEAKLVDAEAECETLAGVGRLLQRAGDERWPDGSHQARYGFVHSIYREIVLASVPPARRETFHRRIAIALERAYGEHRIEIAGRLSAHFDSGNDAARALEYLELAASNAERRFAHREAAIHLRAAVERLARGDEAGTAQMDGEAAARAANLHLRLASNIDVTSGYASAEVLVAFERARDLYLAAGSQRGRFACEMGVAVSLMTSARYVEAQAVTERLIAVSADLPPLRPVALCWSAMVHSAMGELLAARTELERGLELDADSHLPLYFDTPRMLRSQLALVLAELGEVDSARRHAEQALARSRRAGRPTDLAHAATNAAEAGVLLRSPERARLGAEIGVSVSEENGFASYHALCRFYLGWGMAEKDPAGALEAMRAALETRASLGDRWHASMLWALVAGVELEVGDVEGAERSLRNGVAHADQTREQHYRAELDRLLGACALARGRAQEAEHHLRSAAERARVRSARLFELRAATDLADLLREHGRDAEARDALWHVVRSFPEGARTADLHAARGLLGSLGAGVAPRRTAHGA